jgi:hypothetical protein
MAPTLTNDGANVKYYSKNDGKVYQTDFDGNGKKTISNKTLPGIEDVLWSPDKTKVITRFKSLSGRPQFNFYDYGSATGGALSSNIDTVIWQSNSRIIYKYFNSKAKEGSLNISDPNGKNWTNLTPLNTKYISLAPIPKSGLISVWSAPDAFTETFFGSVPILGGETQVLSSGSFGADYLWSNDGNYVLTSSSDKKGGTKINLALLDNKGGNSRTLNVPTFVSKCVWSKDNKTIYYALPGGVPDNSILPNDYTNGKINTTDTFWKVDITTGEKSRIVDLDKIKNQLDATDLFLNSNESFLFFVNSIDGKLYKITL